MNATTARASDKLDAQISRVTKMAEMNEEIARLGKLFNRAKDWEEVADLLRALDAERRELRAQLARARNEALIIAACHAACAFDHRTVRKQMDWNDGFYAGTQAAEAAIMALTTPEAK